MFHDVLVPVDRGLESNTAAIKTAADIVPDGGTVRPLHVTNQDEHERTDRSDGGHPEPIRAALDLLDEYAPAADPELAIGTPADEICRLAGERGVDGIVMCTYGRTGLKRAALGSTTETVIRESDRPVVAVTHDD
jgi:nucleotide-binding universal stress UspA family protein